MPLRNAPNTRAIRAGNGLTGSLERQKVARQDVARADALAQRVEVVACLPVSLFQIPPRSLLLDQQQARSEWADIAGAVAVQRFQPVAWQRGKVAKGLRALQQD